MIFSWEYYNKRGYRNFLIFLGLVFISLGVMFFKNFEDILLFSFI